MKSAHQGAPQTSKSLFGFLDLNKGVSMFNKVLMVLCLVAVCGFSRVGETLEQCKARYGDQCDIRYRHGLVCHRFYICPEGDSIDHIPLNTPRGPAPRYIPHKYFCSKQVETTFIPGIDTCVIISYDGFCNVRDLLIKLNTNGDFKEFECSGNSISLKRYQDKIEELKIEEWKIEKDKEKNDLLNKGF